MEYLKSCRICPLECGADRDSSRGSCGAGGMVEVSSTNLHFGEEPPISGTNGSGTIFLTHCPLKCVFCQNYPISHLGNGRGVSEGEFIDMMLKLQDEGAHNINFVTPTHYSLHIAGALKKMKGRQLKIPTVFNCSGYEKISTLRELEGLIDIYMPDSKFSDDISAASVCRAAEYVKVNREALKEMHRQTGHMELDDDGIAVKGLLIRHLVLPGSLSGTGEVLRFIAEEIGSDTYVSLMAQYHPACEAVGRGNLGRRLTEAEYAAAVDEASRLGLENCFIQDL